LNRAKAERLIQEHLLDALVARDPRNMDLKDTWLALQRALATLEKQSGHKSTALARLQKALAIIQGMIRFDPTNREWNKMEALIRRDLHDLQTS